MKSDWQQVEMPPSLAARPRDARGFPITFVTLIDSQGQPDFTTLDARKIEACITQGICGLCGERWPSPSNSPAGARRPDDHLRAFVGGPLSCESRMFYDPPMHVECAEYAMQVCPHIATPTARYKKQALGGPEQRAQIIGADDKRPEKFGLLLCHSYDITWHQGQPIFLAGLPISVHWNDA